MTTMTVLVLRTSDKGGRGFGGFQWPTRGPVEAPDWIDDKLPGHGLHGLLWGEGNVSHLSDADDAVWQVVRVKAADVRDLGGQVKFPRGYVVFSGLRDGAVAYLLGHGGVGRAVPYAAVTAGDYGTALAGDHGTAQARVGGNARAGHYGTALVGEGGNATVGAYGTAHAGALGHAQAGDGGNALVGRQGTAQAGYRGTARAGAHGRALAGAHGTAQAGDGGNATAGAHGTAQAGRGGRIAIEWYGHDGRPRLAVAYVGEDGIEADTLYKLNNKGQFVKVTP